MKFNIDNATIEYIKQKGSLISIDLVVAKNCCVGISEPAVSFGKPKIEEQFDKYTVDDITVYTNKFIEAKDDALTIKLSKFLGLKNISVYGIKM